MAGALAGRALVRLLQRRAAPARARPSASRGGGRGPARPASIASRRYAPTGSPLPLSSSGSTGLDFHCVAHEPVRRLAEQDLAGRRGFLEALRDVDRVAGREALAAAARVARHDLAGVHAGPDRRCATPQSRSSSSFSPARRSRISAAARTARSASSSCRTGIPNTAITASPMNFSTVPSWRLDDRAASRRSSGSSLAAATPGRGARRAPSTRSRREKTTVTVLRTSRGSVLFGQGRAARPAELEALGVLLAALRGT